MHRPIGNESVPKIIINVTVKFFLKLQAAFWLFQAVTVSECCLIKLLPYILFEKHINILAFKMASCAIYIDTHSLPIVWPMPLPSYCLIKTRNGFTGGR